jgi:hypothetical protein
MAKHALGKLSYEEMRVGVIFGFLKQILRIGREFNGGLGERPQIYFCLG